MCMPSCGRVPAGHGAPVQAGGQPQRGVSPSALLEAGSLGFHQHTILGQLALECPRVSSSHLPCPIECWDYGHVLLCQSFVNGFQGSQLGLSALHGKHFYPRSHLLRHGVSASRWRRFRSTSCWGACLAHFISWMTEWKFDFILIAKVKFLTSWGKLF